MSHHPLPEDTIAKALTRLINLLPHNGLQDFFTAAFLTGLGFAAGTALALYSLERFQELLRLP